MTWRTGDSIVVRFDWRGRLWSAHAATVVVDSPELVAYYLAAGMPTKLPWCEEAAGFRDIRFAGVDYSFRDGSWSRNNTLWLARPTDAHASALFWPAGEDRLLAWYVNLQEPLKRTPIGFDTVDHVLDVVVDPDLSAWRWKDEDEFEQVQVRGWISSDQARQIRAEGEQVVEDIRLRRSPFCDGWESWRPDPAWTLPVIPDGWDQI